MFATLQKAKAKIAAAGLAVGATVATLPAYAAIDVSSVVGEINDNQSAIVAIGGAMLLLVVVGKVFGIMKRT